MAYRLVIKPLLLRMFGDAYTGMVAMEQRVRDSDLEWTILRPPRLTDKPRTDLYRTAVESRRPLVSGSATSSLGSAPSSRHLMYVAGSAPSGRASMAGSVRLAPGCGVEPVTIRAICSRSIFRSGVSIVHPEVIDLWQTRGVDVR